MKHNLLAIAITLCGGFLLPSTGRTQTADNPAPAKTTTLAPAPGPQPAAEPKQAKPAPPPRWIQFGAVIRWRLEDPSGMNFVPGASDGYYLNRIRLDLMVRPTPWLRFFAEGQDGRVFGYNAPTQPASMHNAMDLRQGYIDIRGLDTEADR